ncbi:FAD-binding oxidoreductase [Isoptericola sp. b408]|uniref:FAD-binding oxidoreductase n=1 Tax=Isoptericola sp. b408 TaxID=3064653 RepID=UPI002713D2E9|nr:FAD-binding oxidoreductase [Isoptericola sp. b408]MDO8150357.1 FAD-binding oxidoreductase [Isoptericola sp. b408]
MTVTDLQGVAGTVVLPDDPAYEDARHVYNFMVDKHPEAVVRCANADDVAAVVNYARTSGRPIAVRGGGHSVPGFGTADDAVVADLSAINHVEVDPERRIARVGGGATWGMFNEAAGAHGLATTGGIISTTGVGGLTLGGGIGYLTRAHALSCDNVNSVQIVLADGRQVTASPTQEPDLCWALRGGGGNFGVVTEFEFELHPVGDIYGGPLFFELSDAEAVLRWYREFEADAPRAWGGFPAWQIAPPLPFVPEERVGEPFLALVSCFNGPEAEGARLLEGVRDVATPVAEHVGVMPYPALNSAFDGLVPRGLQHYWKAAFVTELTDEAIAAHLEHGPKVPVVNSTMHLYPIDGAAHDVPKKSTAWGHRDARFACVIAGMWPDPADNERCIAWVKDYYAAIAPHSQQGGYTNFASPDDADKVRENFGGSFDKLRRVKQEYDPENLFRINQNIPPAG